MPLLFALLVGASALFFDGLDHDRALREYEREREGEAAIYSRLLQYPLKDDRGRFVPVTDVAGNRMHRRNYCELYSPHDDCERFIRENVRHYQRWSRAEWERASR